MKKIITLSFIAFLVWSCKTSSVTATKLDNKTEVAIKGDWVITSVDYPGSNYIKVSSFQIADSKCFVGSTWKFISNNNKGEMALTQSNCTAFNSPTTWFVNSNGEFVLKFLNSGDKSKNVRDGYVLKVANLTGSSFQLIDKMNVGGSMTNVVYQFQRAN
jgi:hypothetical protein